MFSRRLHHDLAPNPIALRLEELRGADIVDLTETNPTAVGLDYAAEEILAALADPAALRYTPEPFGLLSAREAVARRAGCEPERVVLTASTSEAYSFLFKLLCDAGDAVLVPQPSYPLFDHLTGLEQVRAVPYLCEWDGAWRIDIESVRKGVSQWTRALLVVSPANPTGHVLRAHELDALADICRAHGLALIADEVFADALLAPPRDAAPRPIAAEGVLTFSLGGLSKSAALPQLKLAWTIVSGPPGLRLRAIERLELIADTYLSVNTPVMHALPRLLDLAPRMQDALRARLAQNLAVLRAAAQGAAWNTLPVEGGWSAVLRVPRTRTDEEWVLHLLEGGVRVHPGWFFDFPREGFLVVSLLPAPSVFAEGVRRLDARLCT